MLIFPILINNATKFGGITFSQIHEEGTSNRSKNTQIPLNSFFSVEDDDVGCKNTSVVSSVIDKFLSTSSLFKDRSVLNCHYIPSELPHRESHLAKITSILVTGLKGGTPSNLFLYGKTGTGKTAATKLVVNSLLLKSRKKGIPVVASYINCNQVNTAYRVLAHLCKEIRINVPSTGLPTDEVYSKFRDGLDADDNMLLIVLDEVDKLTYRAGSDVLYTLTRIATDLQQARVSLIGITNDLKFKEQLDPRVTSSLSEEEIFFAPYMAMELQSILRQRAKMAFCLDVLEFGVINLCAALAAREHGDARRALDLLRVSGELAEREGVDKVTEGHVKKARTCIEQDTLNEFLRTLPIQAKTVLISIYLLEHNGKKDIFSGDVYSAYSELCGMVGIDILTQRRLCDFLSELAMYGVIYTQEVNRGAYGRTRKIKLSVSSKIVKTVLSESYKIHTVFDHIPSVITQTG